MSSTELLRPGTSSRPLSAARHDFRRPAGYARESLRGFAAVHEVFTRSVATGWGTDLRAVIQLEEVAVEQATYGDYIASMPSPNVLATLSLAPLPGSLVVDLSVDLALALVDRLLGGAGTTRGISVRRPTDVETSLLRHLLRHVGTGLRETFGGVTELAPEISQIDYNPQLVQVAAPSDRVAILTYRVAASQGVQGEGLLSICYPTPVADPLLEAVAHATRRDNGAPALAAGSATEALLQDVGVTARVTLRPSPISASELGELRVGDVLRLDHRVDRPVLVQVGDTTVFEGHVGRRGRRFAVQLATAVARTAPDAPHRAGAPSPATTTDREAEVPA